MKSNQIRTSGKLKETLSAESVVKWWTSEKVLKQKKRQIKEKVTCDSV